MIKVVDDFAPNFDDILKESINSVYTDIVFSGTKYPSLSPRVSSWAYPLFEKHIGFKIIPVFDYLRKYEKGVEQPTFIHEDSKISEYTAVLSMRDFNGSLAFWKIIRSEFEIYDNFELKRNRCIIYSAGLYHSRYPRDWAEEDPRLVHVFFFNKGEKL